MVPEIDQDVGMLHYSTAFLGTGGSIKRDSEDFAVSEVIDERVLSGLNQEAGYAVYRLKKHDIDTRNALEQIRSKTGLRLKALGLKDARAVTQQYVCSANKSKSLQSYSSDKLLLEAVGFAQKPLSKKDMVGNRFSITVSDSVGDISEYDEFESILNYFGYQRFGSQRPVTHLVGRALVQKDFEKAVELMLSFTSKHDRPENTELRSKLSDKSNYEKTLGEIPRQMDLERTLVSEMIRHGNARTAFAALPISMRRFFVQAYQSYLFNLSLSAALGREDLSRPQQGDVCFDGHGKLGRYCDDPAQRLTVPLVGYSYFKKTRFDAVISEVLKSEQVLARDFYLSEMQEISSQGGFRNSMIACSDVECKGNQISFTLSRGSFATIVMREIIKPEYPLKCGF